MEQKTLKLTDGTKNSKTHRGNKNILPKKVNIRKKADTL